MALNNAEVCSGCKHFKLMCMCSSQKAENPNSAEASLLRRQSSVTLHSLAIYKSTLKRKQSLRKSPKNQPVLQTQPSIVQEAIEPEVSKKLEVSKKPEVVTVSKAKPVSIEAKRRIILRLVEAVYEDANEEEKDEVSKQLTWYYSLSSKEVSR